MDITYVAVDIYFLLRIVWATTTSFYVPFQSSGKWSKDEWIEYQGDIPALKELTECHWEKLTYFPEGYTTIWSYCSSRTKTLTGLKCVGVLNYGIYSEANRNINIAALFEGWTERFINVTVDVKPYRHRTWNHFCWSYSSITGVNNFYYNGRAIGGSTFKAEEIFPDRSRNKTLPLIEGKKDEHYSAFIIGQEQNGIRGEFSPNEAFYGSIAEFNIWNKTLNDGQIALLADCQENTKGNIISWQENKLTFNKLSTVLVDDVNSFCKKDHVFIIVPELRSLLNGKSFCEIHGGEVAVPKSEEENNEMLNILYKHRERCKGNIIFDGEKSKVAVWLGLQKRNSIWYNIARNHSLMFGHHTKWSKRTKYRAIKDACAYMNEDGSWGSIYKSLCEDTKLCTICSITNTPVFTLKGMCEKGTDLEWNYYLFVNTSHQLSHYEGYKQRSKIQYIDMKWTANRGGAKIVLSSKKYPVGRSDWDWYESSCGVYRAQNRSLTLSICELGTQFTCDSGHCIEMNKRCDSNIDCDDGSDESHCSFVYLPSSYRKLRPPIAKNKFFPVTTQINVKNIDFIDTVNMKIGVTIDMKLTWKDNRLYFTNLVDERKNIIPKETVDSLWNPMRHLFYENAVIGRVLKGRIKPVVTVRPLVAAKTIDFFKSEEDFSYDGNDCLLEMSQRFRIEYICIFKLVKYPFDTQRCILGIGMKTTNQRKLGLIQDNPSIIRNYQRKVQQFEIVEITSLSSQEKYHNKSSEKNGSFQLIIDMKRNYNNQIKSIYCPTVLLWVLAYMTIFLCVTDFANRSRISVTLLLVLVTLFGSLKDDLPKTTYFKFIDLWFLWYIVNVFLIISHHVIIERFHVSHSTGSVLQIKPSLTSNERRRLFTKLFSNVFVHDINKFAAVTFLTLMIIFNVMYFIFTI